MCYPKLLTQIFLKKWQKNGYASHAYKIIRELWSYTVEFLLKGRTVTPADTAVAMERL